MFLSVLGFIVTDTHRYISWSSFLCPSLSLSLCLRVRFSLSVSVSEYIIGNFHVCEQSRSARSSCNSAILRLIFDLLILRVYVRLLISVSFSLFVYECLYPCPAILWLTVCAYTSLLRVGYSLSLWISVLVFGYIVTHFYVYIYVSWSVFFSFFPLDVSIAILSLIVRI